jgi:hypothetical protein
MLNPARVAALLAIPPAVYLSGACARDVPDEAPAIVTEPIVSGPCATACLLVARGQCHWESQCDEDYGGSGMGGREALCGLKFLSCEAAEVASRNESWAISYCRRSCEHLR